MNEEQELMKHIHKDASMAAYSITKLLDDLRKKDNKIKKYLQEILKEYEKYAEITNNELENNCATPVEEGSMAKMMASMGIKKEVMADNSDAAMADMMIKGISMGTIEMEKKISDYKDVVSKDQLKIAKDFLKFQQETIEKLKDKDRYQTVYAKNLGSAAAPTAGLHFTDELLEQIKEKGVIITNVTLHVGLGTFRPVEVSDVTKHHMHSEFYQMSEETADILNNAKKEHRRIIAVGTTSTRTLETIMHKYHQFVSCQGSTDIFIYPGFEFQAIDCLITNFHLPKSTLVMLVSAFSSKENILHAYEEAVKEKYRFFSFGDAMFIKKDRV